MLQEKDMNILTTDIQQERQENNEVDEDQEEFEKLKEVIPTVCQTDSSQVDLFVSGEGGFNIQKRVAISNEITLLSSNPTRNTCTRISVNSDYG